MSMLRLLASSLILLISLVECLVDPERVGLCCGLCDDDGCRGPISGSDANQHHRNCRVYTENETDSCDVDLSLHRHHGWTRSPLLRVVDLVQAEVPRGADRAVMLTWLEPEDDGSEESAAAAAAGLAKSRFVEFYGCRRIDRVMSMRYDDLEDMMGFLGEQESSEYAISLADYGCGRGSCQLTIVRRV